MHRDIKSKNNMSELLNFFRRLLKMYFKLPEWQEKIKNNNLKAVIFSSAHEEAYWISLNWISK